MLTCHFGDLFWVRHTVEQVHRHSDGRVAAVVVVDQNRTDAEALRALPRVSEVLSFEPDERITAAMGHDHPAALNNALRTMRVTTTHVIVLDSDCFPTEHEWLDRIDDVTLAARADRWGNVRHGQTHPCFMVIPARMLPHVDFAEGVVELGCDTGNLVGAQILRAGEVPTVLVPRRRMAFGGTRGQWFLNGAVYHHGSASFVSSPSSWLSQHVLPALEERYRREVEAGSFDATPAIVMLAAAASVRRRLRQMRRDLPEHPLYRALRRRAARALGR